MSASAWHYDFIAIMYVCIYVNKYFYFYFFFTFFLLNTYYFAVACWQHCVNVGFAYFISVMRSVAFNPLTSPPL